MVRPSSLLTGRAPLLMLIATVTTAAWIVLWLGPAAAPAAGHAHHHVALAASSGPVVSLLLFTGGWTMMTLAMMLPTTVPVLTVLFAFARNRRDRWGLIGLAIAGYLVAWGIFGVIAHLAMAAISQAQPQLDWLSARAGVGTGLMLVLAGIYQFTPLKSRCLEKCRSPLSFVIEHWRGRDHRTQAFHLGIDHGIFCVGCCWALMLLMFAVGLSSLGWMAGLAAVMAIEKNVRWGQRLSAPLGVALLAWGGVEVLFR